VALKLFTVKKTVGLVFIKRVEVWRIAKEVGGKGAPQ